MKIINDRFGIYNNKVYRIVEKGEDIYFVSKEPTDMLLGFKPYEKDSSIYIKQVAKKEVKYAYKVWTNVVYKSKVFGLLGSTEESCFMVTEDRDISDHFNFEFKEPGIYVKEIRFTEIEDVIYKKAALPGFELPEDQS
jgi:hypothetical protein